MKTLSAVFFTLILFANLFGYYISFQLHRTKLKAEVLRELKALKKKNVQQFVFTLAEYNKLTKEDNGREFILNGGIYDVVHKQITDSKVILYAYYDHKETGLLDKFASYFNDDTLPESEKQIVSSFSLSDFVFNSILHLHHDIVCSCMFPVVTSTLLSPTIAKSVPPPDISLS